MAITPHLEDTVPNTPVARVAQWVKWAKGRAPVEKRVVTWDRRKLALFISPTRAFYPDGARDTFAIHTEATSRVGTPLLSIELGDSKSGHWDPYSMTINCLAGGDTYTGKAVVRLAKGLARWLGARRIVLMDAAYVTCGTGEPYDLSLYMLMRYGLTWYMREGFSPALSIRGSADRLKALSAQLRSITVREVLADCNRAVEALDRVIDGKRFDSVKFEQPRLWKRNKVTEAHSDTFNLDRVRAVFGIRGNLVRAVRSIDRNVASSKFPPQRPFADFLVALQAKNCSAFYEIYTNLLDNEIYYWRIPICVYHFRVGGAIYRNKLFVVLQNLAALIGTDRAWMVCEDF
jgi:hypothetical protein